jgi:hypothetical protein
VSRELPGYRENLEDILSFTGGKRLLSVGDLCRYTGITDQRTAKRHFPVEKGYISAVTLARCLSEGGRK